MLKIQNDFQIDVETISEMSKIIEIASHRRIRLGFEDLQKILPVTVSKFGMTILRLYVLMLGDVVDGDNLERECLEAILASERWSELIVEMLTNLPFTPPMTRVIVEVLTKKSSGHPCSLVETGKLSGMLRAYDAVDDGEFLRLHYSGVGSLDGSRAVCLMGIEDPVSAWATCSIVENDGRTIRLSIDRGGPLFAEQRYVLPPAVLITQRN